MKRFLLTLTVVAVTALASANLWFEADDLSFDYTNTDTTTAYINLTQDGSDIIVTFSDTMSPTSLPAISVDVPDLGKKDFFSNTIGAELSDITDIEMIKAGATNTGFQVLHENISLAAVVDAYTRQLVALGFNNISVERSGGFYQVNILSNGVDSLRAVFLDSAKGVTARISNQ
jgi:hypothetical protein